MMAKGRKKVSSKMSRGVKRQRELLTSSVCRKHNQPALFTRQLGNGEYQHGCSVCLVDPRSNPLKYGNITGTDLMDLVLYGS